MNKERIFTADIMGWFRNSLQLNKQIIGVGIGIDIGIERAPTAFSPRG